MKMGTLQRLFVNSPINSKIKTGHVGQVLTPGELHGIASVLEIGCGSGLTAQALHARYGMDVVGVDIDPVQIRLAAKLRQPDGRLRFVEGDACALPFCDGSFDLVVSLMVLHHIPDWGRAINEIGRVLKSGGVCVLYDLVYGRLPRKLAGPVLKSHGFFSMDELADTCLANNLQVIRRTEPIRYYLKQFTRFTLVLEKD